MALQFRAAVVAALALALTLAFIPPAQAATGRNAVVDQATALQQWRGPASGAFASAATWSAATLSATTWSATWSATDVVPGQLLVTSSTEAAQSFAAAGYGRTTAVAPGITAIDVEPGTEARAAADIAARDGVVAVEPNRIREFFAVPDDTLYTQQWAHQVTGMEVAWDTTTGSTDVLVAVADSGIVADHPDLGNIVEQVDAGTGEIRPGASDNDPCQVGHGTWVAGVLGGLGNNGSGIAGVNWNVSILDINTADPAVTCAGPTDLGTIAAIAYATKAGADVVNLSLGGPGTACPTALQDVIDGARAAGTLVVASSGNGGDSVPNVPGSCNGAISVGATGPDNTVASYSTTNDSVDVVAPGGAGLGPDAATEILTSGWWNGGQRSEEYVPISGTSFAAPYVSGIAALMRAVNPGLSVDDLESLLESTATDLSDAGRDTQSGWGLVQGAAVTTAAAGGAIPAPQPDPDFPVGDVTPPPVDPRPGGDVTVTRVSAGTGATEPVTQAVAVSQTVFVNAGTPTDTGIQAQWGVLARADDYADALSGSSLTLGVAPLLFTANTGPLAAPTAAELTRTLPAGAPVYLLGGSSALPATLDAEIAALGFVPVRLAGPYREATAVAVADELDRVLVSAGFGPSQAAIVVNRGDWPDAIAAGQLGGQFGIPILLTPAEELSPDTAAALQARTLQELFVVGGTVRVTESTARSALQQAGLESATRLAGEERNGTVVAVSATVEQILAATPVGRPANALAVNVRRADAYAHMLSAIMPLGSFTGVFVPVEDDGGTTVPAIAEAYAAGLGLPLALMGDTDLIADDTGAALEVIVETPPAE